MSDRTPHGLMHRDSVAPLRGPFQVVRDFEQAIADYTGAPYAVAVNSCTMALTLAVAWHLRETSLKQCIEIPKRTYVSVPQAIIHAGGHPTFRDYEWEGRYQLAPLPVWDSARHFTSGMYSPMIRGVDGALCVSFHASKTLGHSQGGAILHNDPEADAWYRRARFDGRSEGVAPHQDTFPMLGWHCYMSPDVAAALLLKLHSLPSYNEPLPNDPYPDLSTLEIFR